MSDDRTHWAYADPNQKRTPAAKLAGAVAAFRDARGAEPAYCVVHPETAASIARDAAALEGVGGGVRIEARPGVGRSNFYLGSD